MQRTSCLVLALFALPSLVALGCGSSPAPDDAGTPDAGPLADASRLDGAAPDGGSRPDAFVPVDSPLGLGAACSASTACASGHCIDGVCCESACDGVCQACISASTGAADGTCAPVLAVDPDDECDASGCLTGACGTDGCEVQPAGFVCRSVAGDCDVPEVCDGVGDVCPADVVSGGETTCRASVGLCDPPEACDGLSPSCPADTIASAGTVCRLGAGVCDVTEVCSGADPQCPTDAFQPTSAALCGAYTCNGATCRTSCATQTDCYGTNVCRAGTCVPGYRIFVTSRRFLPTWHGVAGADALCVAAAMSAGLGPNFRAWLADGTTTPAAHLDHSTLPYYRVDGVTPRLIANDWADLVDGIAVAVASDELGNPQRDEYVWTGAVENGTAATTTCDGWTATTGSGMSGNATAALFSTYYGPQSCTRAQHLYCVEQPPPG